MLNFLLICALFITGVFNLIEENNTSHGRGYGRKPK
jgi:hypothetical protein